MEKREKSGGKPDPRMAYLPLAQWLQMILAMPSVQVRPDATSTLDDVANAAGASDTYHLSYYQQLPDFALALLKNDDQATLHYGPLIYHLTGCSVCHHAYLKIYDA